MEFHEGRNFPPGETSEISETWKDALFQYQGMILTGTELLVEMRGHDAEHIEQLHRKGIITQFWNTPESNFECFKFAVEREYQKTAIDLTKVFEDSVPSTERQAEFPSYEASPVRDDREPELPNKPARVEVREFDAATHLSRLPPGQGSKWSDRELNKVRTLFGIHSTAPQQAEPKGDMLAGGDFYLVGVGRSKTRAAPNQDDDNLPAIRSDASESEREIRRQLALVQERLELLQKESLDPNLKGRLREHNSHEIGYSKQKQRNLTQMVRRLLEEDTAPQNSHELA